MTGLIDTAVSGLKLSQLALSTTGQNIVNANTEGYSRQSVSARTAPATYMGVGYIGTGVTVDQIFRNTEQFLVNQVTSDLSVLGEFEQYLGNVSQMDSLLADPATSIAASIDHFFSALNDVANNPTGLESRQLLLTQTNLMLDRFKTTETKILNHNANLNSQVASFARNITSLGQEIAQLNKSISESVGLANGVMPNDLMDRRDMLINELAQIVDVKTTVQDDLSVSVFVGQGQGLVIGPKPSVIVAVPGTHDASQTELAFLINNDPHIVTEQLSGGEIGGIIRFRKEALSPALNALGRMAVALTSSINAQQQLGVDLEGNLGNPVFTDMNTDALTRSRVHADSSNALPADRRLSVSIDDLSKLTTSDYKLVFPGPGKRYSIMRTQDNTLVTQGIIGNRLPEEISVDGFTINFESGSFQEGDSYLIQPTRSSVGYMDVLIRRPETFALASPISTETGFGNQGGAYVSSAQVTDISTPTFTAQPGQLNPPVIIRFTSQSTYDVLDYSDPANPVEMQPPLNNRTFVPGALNAVFPSEEGGTTVSTSWANVGVAQLSQDTNGYRSETITITRTDPETGYASDSVIQTSNNQPANILAQQLSSLDGVIATASSQLQLYDFTSDYSDIPLGISLNGINLTEGALVANRSLPNPPNADFLRDSINASLELQAQGIIATSDGEVLTVRSSTGVDLTVEVTGNGNDSLKIRDGDLRSLIGRNDLSNGYTSALNNSIELDLGFGAKIIPLTPGTVHHSQVVATLQEDIDRALGSNVVKVTLSDVGTLVLEPMDRSQTLEVTNVVGEDVLGVSPLTIRGPDLGNQPAIVGGGLATLDPHDFTGVNGTFNLSVNGIYTDSITLNQNYPANSGAAIVAAINGQIQGSTGPSGLAGLVSATLDSAGAIQFVSTDAGPTVSVTVSAQVGTQGLVENGTATGAQLSGTRASVTGAADVSSGANFDEDGPHGFRLAVDGNSAVQVNLTGTTGVPAIFSNSVDVSGGVNLTASPNSFELSLAGYPTVVVDMSVVDTSLSKDPFTTSPQGIANLMQQQIDAELGVGVLTVAIDGSGHLSLTTNAKGMDTSITVSNPTGDIATSVFPVVGTAVGSQLGGPGVVNLVRTAVNSALNAAGLDPVEVSTDENGFLTISSNTYGNDSQISVTDVVGGFGAVFPGSDHGEKFKNSATVGGNVDVQLSANTTLVSNIDAGLFGADPIAIDNFTGYQVYLNSGQGGEGLPAAGDTFLIDFNSKGLSDNSNALEMLSLNQKRILSNGNLDLLGAYGQIVEEVGILTSQARVSQEASESLLRQSEAALQSVSGVNIDEEAADLIKFEQHYNASAQLISVARDLFDTILQL